MADEATNHYFDAVPSTPDRRREITTRIWDREMMFTTSSGVFATDGLDKATAVFLQHSTPPSGGTILDLGCGWGPIACAIATMVPEADVWAVDTNERALDLTRTNAIALGADVHAVLPEDVPADLVLDEIWSNPPIRIGKAALHELLLQWLPRLAPDGTARMVVAKNLGADSLQTWLNAQGWPTVRLASLKGFRILQVSRPSRP
ncbi:methyltransferase [Aeromicrobium panaciterrae]|uniref:class I SAM-dependent methyltransferase n=1 Tax=Aeromicrobium panaciterrae TaxID=363861 RepID=UPI0031E271D6